MKTTMFVPKKINVGFQERSDTYTKKLAYIIYFDEKGVLRKEKSWNGWRDEKIDNVICDNVPTEGFVLNKKVGGYDTGWNHRNTYTRVYDPRGFEFEITVENLLYILENTSSIKGKGLEGEFVYAWEGKDLILVPVDSPDYVEIEKYNKIVHENNFIKAKDLKLGAIYLTKDNQQLIYLGKFDEYDYGYRVGDKVEKKKAKSFYFYNRESKWNKIEIVRSLSKKFISIVSEDCVEDYATLMDELECNSYYSPIDRSKDEFYQYTFEEFIEQVKNRDIRPDDCSYYWCKNLDFYGENGIRYRVKMQKDSDVYSVYKGVVSSKYYSSQDYYNFTEYEYIGSYWSGTKKSMSIFNSDNLETIFNHFKPSYKKIYLANGKLYTTWK